MTSRTPVYLKQNSQFGPLFNQWYAWTYLIAPATAPRYIANLHLKIMQSFISTPQAHVSALKNPAMRGGPFINYDASRVNDIRALMEKTEREQAHMLKYAEAVRILDQMMASEASEASGYSLEPLYVKVPDILKGFVELVYDLNNHASVRFIEGLLYKSPYYDPSRQSIALSLAHGDGRPFIFSTPSLEGDGRWNAQMPFHDERLDELFKMKDEPQPYTYIKDLFGVKDEDDEQFSPLFTE